MLKKPPLNTPHVGAIRPIGSYRWLISQPEAALKLRKLNAGNVIFQNNTELLKEAGSKLAGIP